MNRNELIRLLQQYEQTGASDAGYAPAPEPAVNPNVLQNLMSEQERFAMLPQEEQAVARLPVGSMRNEQTGKITYFAPQGQTDGFADTPFPAPAQRGAPPQQRIRVAGFGNDGITSDLGETTGAAPALDYQRGAIDTPKGRGWYGKDGAVYVKGPDGVLTKVVLGYDRDASFQAAERDFRRRKGEAELAQTQEQTESLRAARNVREDPTSQKFLDAKYGKLPEGQRWTPDGRPEKIDGAAPKLTEFQGKSSAFGTRAANAHEVLNAIGDDGKIQPGLIKRFAESVPLVGGALGLAANFTQSDAQQRVERAERDFINATLRQESGAVISPSEFANARQQYFPQPGDTADVIRDKRRARELVIASFADSAGPAADKVTTAGAQAKKTFDSLPNPAQFTGKRMRFPNGGIYRSDGSRWVRQ